MEAGSETCPFVMLEIYMQKGGICKDREAHNILSYILQLQVWQTE